MPRLLILCEYPTLLGGERSMLATLPAVAAAGFEVHIAAPAGGELEHSVREHGISYVPLRTRQTDGERLALSDLRREIDAEVRRLQPSLVHANSLSMARIAGPAVAERGVPSLGHIRDIVRLSGQAIQDINSHRELIAVSNAARRFHVSQGIDGGKCVVAYNGVDLTHFCPRPPTGYLHRELNLPSSAQLIAVIGQLGLRKGADVALDAAARIAADEKNLQWLVIGERTSGKDESREFEHRIKSAAAEPPLLGRVHFLDGRRDVPELMTECTLLLHMARQEPLGRVLLEAAASGLPVVATEVGGTREIFPSEKDGALLVSVDDARAAASGMLEVLNDAGRREVLARGARRRAEDQFDIAQAAQRVIEIYESALI